MKMIRLEEWAQELKSYHLPRWEELPELELYMDQVITLVDRYLSPVIETKKQSLLSSAMVNNYVKHKLMPSPVKKRYNKNHLAYLIAITMLKQILAIPNIKELIVMQVAVDSPKDAYNNFCQKQEDAFVQVAKQVLGESEQEAPKAENSYHYLVLESAAAAFTRKMLVEKIIELEQGEKKDE